MMRANPANPKSCVMRMPRFHNSVFLVAALIAAGCSISPRESQRTFATPEAATEAMFQAISKGDTTALFALLGPDSRPLVIRADKVQTERERQIVTAAMIERWWLEGEGDKRTIFVGNESYPLPIPLVAENGKWRFDTATGKEEILYRRVGRDELAIMDVAAAFADAQHEYAAKGHDGTPRGAFAQRFLSDTGKHNGLYWPATTADATPSPMGELAAKAASAGYQRGDRGAPYHGYYLKVLTEQGPHAKGGQRSWIVRGAMTGGFGLIAWPAEYRASGVMTFMVGPDGAVRQRDLGEDTDALAPAITAFDTDSSWSIP